MSTESESQTTEAEPAIEEADAGETTDTAEAESDPLEEAQAKISSLKDQLLRTAADFDNFRKRSRREMEDARISGREAMLKELLPVFDNLERALAAAESATDVKSFASGIHMVTRQFHEALLKSGIERVLSVGHPFDPSLHEAIQHLETEEQPPGHVVAEVQGGYRAGQRLLRPAVVVVAKHPAPAEAPSGE